MNPTVTPTHSLPATEAIMHHGIHKGKRLHEIPPSYLLWYWHHGGADEGSGMHSYIRENFAAICAAAPHYKVTVYPNLNQLKRDKDGKLTLDQSVNQ